MTNEQQQLLIKDLSARLSYGVKCFIEDDYDVSRDGTLYEMDLDDETCGFKDTGIGQGYWYTNVVNVKPYLRPMSSMTEEEKIEYNKTFAYYMDCPCYTVETFDWLNAHYFDFLNLIGRGLAIDCTGLNIY